MSNGTGELARDPVAEASLRQVFADHVVSGVSSGRQILGTRLDPVWLWPVESKIDKDVFMGQLNTCDIRMHNLKQAQLLNVQVRTTYSTYTLGYS